MNDVAIDIRNVGKTFRLYPDLVRSRIKQFIFPWKKYYTEKEALKGINLQIKKGEIIGVIGPNGSGKTTLLKLIAGISYPNTGKIKTSGRVVAVLALGLGFHPRLTGLQNIELAGMMLGMSRDEVRQRLDWIVKFAELEDYIAYPLTTYSTGMRARLSFAVAASQEPDILIIDEALATGDIRFVQKCIDRIHEITKSGTTALFVSHNIWSIKRLTNRCLLIEDGRIVEDGESGAVADRYYEVMLRHEVLEPSTDITSLAEFVGTGDVKLRTIKLRDADGKNVELVNAGEAASFLLELEAAEKRPNVSLHLSITRNDGVHVCAIGSMAGGGMDGQHEFGHPRFDLPSGISMISINMPNVLLAPGDYSVDLHIFDADSHSGYTNNEQFYFKPRVMEFGVRKLGNPNRSIIYYQPASITLEENSDET